MGKLLPSMQRRGYPDGVSNGTITWTPVSNYTPNMVLSANHMMRDLFSSDDQSVATDKDEDDVITPMAPNTIKNMSNSERGKYYRRKRKVYATKLQHRVTKLRLQIEALTISRQVQQELALSRYHTRNGRLVKIVEEYVTQFRHGTPTNLSVMDGEATTTLSHVPVPTPAQILFLHAAMVEDVRLGEFRGISEILDQWQRYSAYHAGLQFTIKSLDVISHARSDDDGDQEEEGVTIIKVNLDLRARFVRKTIEHLFPHLLADEVLMQELIGLEITYPVVNRFYFNADGKIERYDPEVDVVAALLEKIPSLTKVARIVDKAMIHNQHYMGPVGNHLPSSTGPHESSTICERESRFVELSSDEEEKGTTETESDNDVTSLSRMDLDFILS